MRAAGNRAIRLAALVLALAAGAAAAASKPCRERQPETWDIVVAEAKEPGEPLVVEGTVRDDEGMTRGGVTIYVYQADARGVYGSGPENRTNPRLCGILLTGADGRYRVRTVMPGGYGGVTRHVHFETWGRGIERQVHVLNLGAELPKGGRADYFSKRLGALGMDRFAAEQPVTRDSTGTLRCARDLRVRVK